MWPYMWNILRNWKEIAFEAPSEVWQALGRTGFFKRPFIGRRGVFRPILGNVGLRAGTKMSGKSFRVSDGDWICPDKKCGNVNFARRTSCNRCGREKTTEAKLMKSGGTEIGKTLAEKSRGLFSANDWQCKTCGNVNWARRSECNMCNTPKYAKLEERTGYGGGFNERENVEYIEREESDGEYDEFGRKKKKYRGKNVAGSTKENEKKPEKDDREEEEEDDDEEGDLSKYKLDDDDEDDDADLSKYDLDASDEEKAAEKKGSRSGSSRSSSRSSSSGSRSRSRSRSRSSSSSRSRSRSRSSSQDNGRSRRSRSRSSSRSRKGSSSPRKGSRSRSPSSSPERGQKRSRSRSSSGDRKKRRSRSQSSERRRGSSSGSSHSGSSSKKK